MASKRPPQLTKFLNDSKINTDSLILQALEKLEDPRTQGQYKATVESLMEMTNFSRNTIRNRDWALNRLRLIKKKLKVVSSVPKEEQPNGEFAKMDEFSKLQKKLSNVMQKNALLYNEVLYLREKLSARESELLDLNNLRLRLV